VKEYGGGGASEWFILALRSYFKLRIDQQSRAGLFIVRINQGKYWSGCTEEVQIYSEF